MSPYSVPAAAVGIGFIALLAPLLLRPATRRQSSKGVDAPDAAAITVPSTDDRVVGHGGAGGNSGGGGGGGSAYKLRVHVTAGCELLGEPLTTLEKLLNMHVLALHRCPPASHDSTAGSATSAAAAELTLTRRAAPSAWGSLTVCVGDMLLVSLAADAVPTLRRTRGLTATAELDSEALGRMRRRRCMHEAVVAVGSPLVGLTPAEAASHDVLQSAALWSVRRAAHGIGEKRGRSGHAGSDLSPPEESVADSVAGSLAGSISSFFSRSADGIGGRRWPPSLARSSASPSRQRAETLPQGRSTEWVTELRETEGTQLDGGAMYRHADAAIEAVPAVGNERGGQMDEDALSNVLKAGDTLLIEASTHYSQQHRSGGREFVMVMPKPAVSSVAPFAARCTALLLHGPAYCFGLPASEGDRTPCAALLMFAHR